VSPWLVGPQEFKSSSLDGPSGNGRPASGQYQDVSVRIKNVARYPKLSGEKSSMKNNSFLRSTGWLGLLLAVIVFGLASPGEARAQNSVGGHIGVVFPLVTRADGNTTNIGDNFTTGFPMGITVKREGSKVFFDLELVPAIVDRGPRRVNLTVHPGVLRDLGSGFTGGLRAAFDVNSPSWGFTPLLNKGWSIGEHKNNKVFIEFVLPIRFQRIAGDNITAVTFGIHLGTAF
jgi:hypothetical protein